MKILCKQKSKEILQYMHFAFRYHHRSTLIIYNKLTFSYIQRSINVQNMITGYMLCVTNFPCTMNSITIYLHLYLPWNMFNNHHTIINCYSSKSVSGVLSEEHKFYIQHSTHSLSQLGFYLIIYLITHH